VRCRLKIGALRVEVLVPGAQSLKDKRQVIRSLKDRVRAAFNCSIAEVGFQDKWQRAALGVAVVGTDVPYVRGALDEILGFLRREPTVELGAHEMDTF
jgi:uncharacterized protein